MTTWIRRLGGTTVLLLLLVVASPTASHAAQTPAAGTPASEATPRFNIQALTNAHDGYFDLQLAAGSSAKLKAMIGTTNDSAPVKLRTYRANAINIVNGGFGAATEQDPPAGPTTWVDYPTQTLDMDSGQRKEIDFSVTVPANTAPGQYVTALVAQTDGPVDIPGMSTFTQVIRSAVSIAITVPGPVHAGFTLGTPAFDTSSAAPHLVIPIQNTGNTLVRPKGTLTVATSAGQTVATAPVTMGSVYGGYSTTIDIALPSQLKPGTYVVSGTLSDTATKTSATVAKQQVTLTDRNVAATFTIDPVAVTASGTPIQYATAAVTVNNGGQGVPTARVVLRVTRDGNPLEDYVLADNQVLASGKTTVSQRYIPKDGWKTGTYGFTVIVSSVDTSGTETVLATVPVSGSIVVP